MANGEWGVGSGVSDREAPASLFAWPKRHAVRVLRAGRHAVRVLRAGRHAVRVLRAGRHAVRDGAWPTRLAMTGVRALTCSFQSDSNTTLNCV